MTKKVDNQKLELTESDAKTIIFDRGCIVNRQRIAEGVIEFMRTKEWKYLGLSKNPEPAEVARRDTLYASRVYLEDIPKKGAPNISKEDLEDLDEDYDSDFIGAVTDFQHSLFKAIDEYVNAIDALEERWWKVNQHLFF